MQAAGGIDAGIDLDESCIVPSLLANCSTWMEAQLRSIQRRGWMSFRTFLDMSSSRSPRLGACAALGFLGMRWRLWEANILLVLAIWGQEDICLARQLLQEQIRMGWPELGREVMEIFQKIGPPDASDEEVDIEKEAVKEAIIIDHLQYPVNSP